MEQRIDLLVLSLRVIFILICAVCYLYYKQQECNAQNYFEKEKLDVSGTHGAKYTNENLEELTRRGLEQPNIFVVAPTYNNYERYFLNLGSIARQNYPYWKVYTINDVSTDGTGEGIKRFIDQKHLEDKIFLINNQERKLAMRNIYETIAQFSSDDDIVVIVDGDDTLSDPYVFDRIIKEYRNPDIWLTYGQYISSSSKRVGICSKYPQRVIDNCSFRSDEWRASHLKTFRSKLFKKINVEDFKLNGEFFEATYDMAIMFPMLEMACNNHFAFIPETLYVYYETPLNDHIVRPGIQKMLDRYIRQKEKYEPLESLD